MKTESDVGELLEEGDLRVLGLLPRASNYTFLGEIRNGPRRLPVVYKPRAGETPLWDFPDGTLGNREVAAFVLAEALGWPNVPPTVLRHGPHGVGSVQLYVEADPGEHYFTLRERRLEETRRQIDAETKRSLDAIRSEVADLTLAATARVTGKVLDAEDQRRLIDEAIAELDFSALEKETT